MDNKLRVNLYEVVVVLIVLIVFFTTSMQERMTLKHKNTSKWATRILQRGLQVQDEGTRAAISEQLHQHALLTRKMNSMKDNSSSSDGSSDEDDIDEDSAVPDQGRTSKLLEKAKEKTLKILDEEDEIPKTGLFSLPFMVSFGVLWLVILRSFIYFCCW